ncbi:glycosyl hydrolase family 8 [Sphingomonas hylomeconis]|uniref:cellulase n=1 Tax=Sphingomonas hylomeconis TaxID=1395958 RepID=A0ABV7SV53_9SPHN|nr:glycosyl hydrolase family 8 [Sphingomonas hylomeconis]
MDVDRRRFMAGMSGLAIAGCSRAQARPGVDWPTFKARFMDASGRIVDNGNGGISHSEGQGYGLLFAVAAGDRDGFDRLLRWTEATLARPDIALYCWRFDPRQPDPVADRNNATDGDLLIALALARAGVKWREPRFTDRSAAIRGAIATRLVRKMGGRTLLLPGMDGFAFADRLTINPCYYLWTALDAFARADPTGPWRRVIGDGEALLTAARFGKFQLPTDWIDVSTAGQVSPAAGKPPRFGFDAIRIPLYAAAANRGALIAPIRAWWQSYPPAAIPAWIDVVSGQVAEYTLSPGGLAAAGRVMGRPQPGTLSIDYYAAVLQLLARTL